MERDYDLLKEVLSVPSKTYQEDLLIQFICDWLDKINIDYYVDDLYNIYATKQNDENIVLGPSIVVDETVHQDMTISEDTMGCIEILKSGPSKGKKCGCKVVSDNMCKRHKNHF